MFWFGPLSTSMPPFSTMCFLGLGSSQHLVCPFLNTKSAQSAWPSTFLKQVLNIKTRFFRHPCYSTGFCSSRYTNTLYHIAHAASSRSSSSSSSSARSARAPSRTYFHILNRTGTAQLSGFRQSPYTPHGQWRVGVPHAWRTPEV